MPFVNQKRINNMSRFFINTNTAKDTAPSAKGWGEAYEYDINRIPFIEDTVHGGIALQKMGTSIPHPFARLYVFDTAFDEINAGGDEYITSYAKLVSECLDFIEFLYQFGDSITVKEWGKADIRLLKESDYPGHKKLGIALEKAMENIAFNSVTGDIFPMQSAYLFFYNGALLGGTSPLTLVYTSPNIAENLRKIDANGFYGLNGNNLFQDYSLDTTQAVPLSQRSQEFKDFLMHYYFAYLPILNRTSIGKYIALKCQGKENWNDFKKMDTSVHQAMFNQQGEKYAQFQYSSDGLNFAPVDIIKGNTVGSNLFIPLAYKYAPSPSPYVNENGESKPNSNVGDDYQIRPDIKPDGEVLPLVLNQMGLPGAKLVNNLPQNEGLNLSSSENIENRILPTGHNIPYPYIYVDDLIEDKLIRMPYEINADGFVSVSCGNEYFLIPVKPLFLKYFKVSRISQFLSLTKKGDNYIVTLNIPIEYNNQSIGLTKSFTSKEVVDFNDGSHNLGVAVFPSYRIKNKGEDALNIYKVLISDTGCQAEAVFIKGHEEMSDKDCEDRIKNLNEDCINHFYSIKKSFDAIRIKVNGICALIVPKFFDVTIGVGNITAGVDFGTTNTYICINDEGSVSSLSISENKPQVLTLNKVNLNKGNSSQEYNDSMQPRGLEDYYYTFVRQFVPHILGTDDATASFPFRTIACEGIEYQNDTKNAKVLSDVSIGFNNLNEAIDAPKYKYVSNLKWLLDQKNPAELQANIGRVAMFIEEIAWLIKNSVMLSDSPTKNFTVFTTYPGSMRRIDISKIGKFWENAFASLLPGGKVNIDSSIKESAAPFLYKLGTTGAVSTNSVNVDIGGGTTDILYIDADNNVMYADSSKFAGNDIWGDGIEKKTSNKVNGFFKMIDSQVSEGIYNLESAELNKYNQQKKRKGSSSADMMSYIFENEDIYEPSTYFDTNASLKNVLFTHFSALCFHIANTMKAKNINTKNLTVHFSGFGSKYINMILPSDELIASTMGAMFNRVGLSSEGLKVETDPQVSPKEITARGAVFANSEDVREELEKFTGVNLVPKDVILNFGKIDSITKKEMASKKDDVLNYYIDFIDNYLTNGDYANYLRKNLDVRFTDKFVSALKDYATISAAFSSCAKYDEEEKDDEVNETAFFWPFKEALVKASQLES